ncbi:MAG: flagellar basal body P-ring protein FlgI [Telmatospirillum sp.]|nr:flagellar basal body P-ring protein FlgI [Telmatospirillum sp.]
MRRVIARRFAIVRHAIAAFAAAAVLFAAGPAGATSRIKDIADFEGVRDNILIGYGLVVGLNGTGDGLDNSEFTKQSMIAMLERLGVNARSANLQAGSNTGLKAKDVAAVIVTARLPAFARQGTRIDVTASAIGDSTSLLGGTLLVTPLIGADGEVYAVGQGQVSSGYSAQGAAASVTKGVPTSGRIANGALVEREVGGDMSNMESVQITLRNPDFTTARRVSQAVNSFLGTDTARPTDPSTVRVAVPPRYRGNTVAMLTDIEQLHVQPDQVARVVIDDRTGTIVMGENVRISTVAIAQGNLTIRITETPQVSQPSPFSSTGQTTTVARTDIQTDEGSDKKLALMQQGVTLQELVNGLNALGIGPRDLISILQAIKAAGALQADIEVM